ncbi:hypothetical protein [uncultured Paraglaciecola sp.]|uniref:hypothetical protein n=1 Tax=uncultured Paraglaciecola sp. TaxID=1765024 RepID=UPI0026073CA4|nr:hypothetical protein [uncultured Paraglaciecola sp.]
MTNTTTLLSDAEKRVEDGDAPDECLEIHRQWMVGKYQAKACLSAAYEAGRLAGVVEGKRELLTKLCSQHITSAGPAITKLKVYRDGQWILETPVTMNGHDGHALNHGDCIDSLIEYLEQQR